MVRTAKDRRVLACPSTGLLLLLFLATPAAQAWQAGPVALARLRSQVSPSNRISRSPSGLLRSRTSSSPLFGKVNGSGKSNKGINGDSSNGSQPQQPRRRSGIRSRVSNLWSGIFHSNVNGESKLGGTSLPSPPAADEIVDELETENKLLRETIRQLELENDRLASQQKLVLESFEGEGKLRAQQAAGSDLIMEPGAPKSKREREEIDMLNYGITLTGEELTGDVKFEDEAGLWCDDLDEDSCPVEPTISFGSALRDRAYWLVGLLVMQSCSGLILSRNEALLANHPIIIYFLTMLVGAGGRFLTRVELCQSMKLSPFCMA